MADGQVEVEEATARNRATPEPPPYRTAHNLDGSGRRPQNLALGAWTGGAGANPHDSSSSSTHLLGQREGDAVVDLAERGDVLVRSGLLAAKLVRREAEDLEAALVVGGVQLLEAGVL